MQESRNALCPASEEVVLETAHRGRCNRSTLSPGTIVRRRVYLHLTPRSNENGNLNGSTLPHPVVVKSCHLSHRFSQNVHTLVRRSVWCCLVLSLEVLRIQLLTL